MNVIYSSIHPNFKRKVLLRGCLSAFPGFIFLFFFGVYGTPLFLETWGILIFAIGIGSVAWGLIPYRKLSRLETHPHRIAVEKDNWQITTGKKTYTFEQKDIESIQYIHEKNRYGIEITIQGKKEFFSFFSRSAYARLHDIMHVDETDETPPF